MNNIWQIWNVIIYKSIGLTQLTKGMFTIGNWNKQHSPSLVELCRLSVTGSEDRIIYF